MKGPTVTCNRCGNEGVTFGHIGLCKPCYAIHMARQADLFAESQRNRELLAARIVHPAGKTARQKASDLWIQKRDRESGRNSA